ncbi:COX6A-domain-containing protein [Xylariaceae sp. FL0804]|nr:COX6A-domain-containing protein [Xylariaceae sp. FL0804]
MFAARLLQRAAPARASPGFRGALQRRGIANADKYDKLDNAFIRERRAVKEHAAKTADLWRRICVYVIPPALILQSFNAYNLWVEHWQHWETLPPLEERIEYPYQNIRTKPFPWGDGDKTLFWNDKVNYHKKDKQM